MIASANGYGNVGDDLIAQALKSMLSEIDSQAEVKLTRPQCDPKEVAWADAVIIGGGGLLYDYDKVRSNVSNYLSYVKVARKLKKPVYLIGIAEQGIFTEAGKAAYRRELSTVNLITVRSKTDRDVLRSIGVEAPILALQDLVFSMSYGDGNNRARKARRKLPGRKPRLALSLPQLTSQGLELEAMGKDLARQLKLYEAYLKTNSIDKLFKDFKVTLVCQSRDDLAYCQVLSKRHQVKLVYPEDIAHSAAVIKAYSKADIVLTGRLHGLILAAMLGKPIAAFGLKSQKLDKLIEERLPSLQPSFFSLDDLVKGKLFESLGKHYKTGKIKRPDPVEVDLCRRLAKLNKPVLEAALLNDFGAKISSSKTRVK